jgi:hypothetical protein
MNNLFKSFLSQVWVGQGWVGSVKPKTGLILTTQCEKKVKRLVMATIMY